MGLKHPLKTIETYEAKIHMAGDIETAKQFLRRKCYDDGLCVTVTPTTFIYTGGEEQGFIVGFVNYPRFPSEPWKINERARLIAAELIVACCQRTALLVASDETVWIVIDPPGAAP